MHNSLMWGAILSSARQWFCIEKTLREGRVVGDCVHGKKVEWKRLESEDEPGRIVTYRAMKETPDGIPTLPIRDVVDSWEANHIYEPNYNTGTYNLHSVCHQNTVSSIISKKNPYLFFASFKETRREKNFFISGYYRIGFHGVVSWGKGGCRYGRLQWKPLEERKCLKATEAFFLKGEDLIWIDHKLWRKLKRSGKAFHKEIVNPLHLNIILDDSATRLLLEEKFGGHDNAIDDYIEETRKVSNNHHFLGKKEE